MSRTSWLLAQAVLHVWDPTKWSLIRDPKWRRRCELFYRAKGIVCHDRALNGEPILREPEERTNCD